MNTTKSVSRAFHLNNHKASKTSNIKVKNRILPSDPNPKYLGVTLDRRLNYRKYLEGCDNKIAERNCFLRKLAGTTWGARVTVQLNIALLCGPEARTPNCDVKLREWLSIVGGCLKSTPI
ncbi:hypothetical protein ElyMa_000898300 [Elysia marginata]|uniref:Uncharacterized protein n=1 Tax=Elysia marginata TaxID=1093978 RepID=A0AAV4H7I9_9GAST|nr:hypothetical protein ElyMa_000898300 [Elysia marginata]